MAFPTPPPPPPPHPPAPPQGEPQLKKSPEHWTAIAALITAVTGVLTFLVGFIGLPAAGVNSPAASIETATSTVTATVTTTAPPPSGTSDPPTSASGSPELRWSGPLLVSGDFNLDSVPPQGDWPTDGDIEFSGINDGQEAELSSSAAVLAVVPQGETPDAAECTVLVQTQGQRLKSLAVAVGGKLCLITSEGRPALVTVTAVHSEAQNVSLNARIWQKTD